MEHVVARLEVLETVTHLVLYATEADIGDGPALCVIELTNAELTELLRAGMKLHSDDE